MPTLIGRPLEMLKNFYLTDESFGLTNDLLALFQRVSPCNIYYIYFKLAIIPRESN